MGMILTVSITAQNTNKSFIDKFIKQKDGYTFIDGRLKDYLQDFNKLQQQSALDIQKAIKQKMDSAILFEDDNYTKIEFFYNNSGKNISRITYTLCNNSEWVKTEKTEFLYNDSELIKTQILYVCNDEINWVKSEKQEYTYNKLNNLILIQGFTWYEAIGEWIINNEEKHYYDANQNDTLYTTSSYNETYDSLIYYSKEENTYDVNNNIICMKSFQFDSISMKWVEFFKLENTYNLLGNVSNILVYLWDTTASDWSLMEKIEYIYNIYEKDSLQFTYMWFGDYWMELMKVEYRYDANQNFKTNITYMSDYMGGWENYYKYEYTVNTAYSSNDILLPNNIDFSQQAFANEVTQISYYEYSTDWILSSQKDYYYSQIIVSIIEPNTLEVTIYPNPSRDNINIVATEINNPTMQIINNLGQIVMQKTLNQNTTQVDISGLKAGIYFVNIKTKDESVTKKIMKE